MSTANPIAPASASFPTIQVLPRLTVQDTFTVVLDEIKSGLHAVEDCWVSCYMEGSAASVHGRVRISETEEGSGEVELVAREGVQVELVGDVSCLSSPFACHRMQRC